MQPSRYKNLFKQIEKYKPRSILEIGVYDGQHSFEMIKFAQRFQGNVYYYGFDLFEAITPEIIKEENSKDKVFTEDFIRTKLAKTGCVIKLYKGFTRHTLPQFIKKVDESKLLIDFVFIDGGHSIETIKNDWQFVQKIMHEKTVVIFDDYYPGDIELGCKCVIDSLEADEKYQVDFLLPIDIFQKEDWIQKTQMVKISQKHVGL